MIRASVTLLRYSKFGETSMMFLSLVEGHESDNVSLCANARPQRYCVYIVVDSDRDEDVGCCMAHPENAEHNVRYFVPVAHESAMVHQMGRAC